MRTVFYQGKLLLSIYLIISCFACDSSSRFEYNPEVVGDRFCDCMQKELKLYSNKNAYDICWEEARKSSYFLDMFQDSMNAGVGFSRQSLTDSAKAFMIKFDERTLPCRFLDGKWD